jgi:hypothetical protein
LSFLSSFLNFSLLRFFLFLFFPFNSLFIYLFCPLFSYFILRFSLPSVIGFCKTVLFNLTNKCTAYWPYIFDLICFS